MILKSPGAVLTAVLTVVVAGAVQPAHAAEPPTVDLAALRDHVVASAPIGSTGKIDHATGTVVLTVPAGTEAQIPARRHVQVKTGPGGITAISGLVGGHTIHDYPGRDCTAGFIALDDSGNDYVVTAGHCGAAGTIYYRNGKRFGNVVSSTVGGAGDYGAIIITRNFHGEPILNCNINCGLTKVWGLSSDYQPGQHVCKMGSATRQTCGNIIAVDVTTNSNLGVLHGLIETDLCAARGDSGGPLFVRHYNQFGSGAYGIGIASVATTDTPCGDPGFRTYFQPLGEALDAMGLTLMTAPMFP